MKKYSKSLRIYLTQRERIFGVYNIIVLLQYFFLFLQPSLLAQTKEISHNQLLKFEHISTAEGLSQSTVACILRDSKGFMWFGTANGLNKYDGYTFTVYYNDFKNPSSLSSNWAFSIYEDISDVLWVGTGSCGLNKFNREKETFTTYKNDTSNPNSISDNQINSIYESPGLPGILWIGTENGGLNRFDTKTEIFTHYKQDPSVKNSINENTVTTIYESVSEPGVLWIGTEGGLNRFDLLLSTFKHFKHDPLNSNTLSNNYISSIYELTDKPGILWLGTGSGLNKFDIKNEQFIHYKNEPKNENSLSHNSISSLYGSPDEPGTLYIGTRGGGLNKMIMLPDNSGKDMSPDNVKFFHYKNEAANINGISSNDIWSIYEDPKQPGVMWIGTYDKGIDKCYKSKKRFYHYKHDPENSNSLVNNIVWSTFEDNSGTLWIGTSGGLSSVKLDEQGNRIFRNYKHDPKNQNSLSGNLIFTVTGQHDNPQILWLGTMDHGLNKLILSKDKNANPRFIHYKHDSSHANSLSNNTVRSLCQSNKNPGVLWIATDGGLNKFTIKENSFQRYVNDPENPNSLSNNSIYNICESLEDPNILWLGTRGGGLNKFNILTESFIIYKNDPENLNSLSSDFIVPIYQSQRDPGVLWIGTWGGGLNKFDIRTETFDHFTVEDGLASNSVGGIIEDNNGNLWISTISGLSVLNLESNTFRNYDIQDGLQDNAFNGNTEFKSKNGELYFGGINGFNAYYPDDIRDNLNIPKIVITDLKVFNKSVAIKKENLAGLSEDNSGFMLEKSVSETDLIELSYQHNFFSLEFAALDYSFPTKNQYAYKMEGFDNDWIHVGNRRYASYTNLSPGEYTFLVKGSNNDRVWNNTGASVRIIIHPPWWKTWWAYLLFTVIILVAFSGSTKLYLNRQRLKHQLQLEHEYADKQEEISQIKSRFFANISHEFRTPLTLILGPLNQIIEQTDNEKIKEEANTIHRSAKKLNRLVDQLLDLTRIEAGKMVLKTSPQNIVFIIKEMVLSFQSFAECKKINLKIIYSEEEIILYLDKDKTDKIFSNIFSNALKFTQEGGKVTVMIIRKNDFVEVNIADNGMGIPEDRKDRVFDRFYQVNSGITREQEGTGIGLALTKELVELHKGIITVESQVGKGSAFKVALPLGKEHLKPEEIAEDIPGGKTETEIYIDFEPERKTHTKNIPVELLLDSSKRLILIVEDNPQVRKYLSEILSGDYKIIEAVDGVDGINKSFEHIPDLIISDIMMPKLDGYKFCSQIKNDIRTSHIPLILLTAKAEKGDEVKGLVTGADDYVMKPFDPELLKVRIKNLLEQRKRIHEHFKKIGLNELHGRLIGSIDQKFLQKIFDTIMKYLDDDLFGVEKLADEMAVHRSLLHKKVTALVGESPVELIKRIRLNTAAKLIEKKAGNISEIALEVGFQNPAYFSECFKKQFGISPSKYHFNINNHSQH